MSNTRQWWMVGGVAAVLAGLLLAGWLARDRFIPVEVGSPAPDFAAHTLEGEPVRLSGLEGEVVLLNIWATWCGPCVEEMPSLQRLHERFRGRGFRVVAVSIDAPAGSSTRRKVSAFTGELGLTFDLWLDPSGDIQRLYRTTGVPESFVIDREGVIVKKVVGATEWDSEPNAELIQRLLSS
ncbi:MAG: peroxiredoxin family protein [Longimicrobiaceae bacterium]